LFRHHANYRRFTQRRHGPDRPAFVI
jgi:hypothetical protein